MARDYSDILITEDEQQEIRNAAPDKMPLNPTNQGWSGSAVRRQLSKFASGTEKSILSRTTEKLEKIKEHFEENDTVFLVDDETVAIDYTLVANNEKTFTQECTSVSITVPATVDPGFIAEVTFKTGASVPTVTFVNESLYDLKLLRYREIVIETYIPSASKTVSLLIFCDGINVCCHIAEV